MVRSLLVMGGQRGADWGDLPAEERRCAALVAFIGELVLDDRGELVSFRAARLPRLFFMFAQAPSTGLR